MKDLDIKKPVFEDAFIDGSYSKSKMVEMINEIINPEILNESDETILGSVLFSINDSGAKNLNIVQLISKIELNKTIKYNKVRIKLMLQNHWLQRFSQIKIFTIKWLNIRKKKGKKIENGFGV